MLYLYDNALAKNLSESIDCSSEANSIVKVIEPEGVTDLMAQIQEDRVSFPLICLFRNEDNPIDTARTNFTQMKRGIPVSFDNNKNNMYYEKAIPIELGYTLTILTTNTADMDEIVKELMFKYMSEYFISIDLPYEADRKIRFGVQIDENSITKKSGSLQYLKEGSLYQTQIGLKCDGAVLLSYTPRHLQRQSIEGIKIQ